MAMVDTAVPDLLGNDAGVSAVIGSRVYPVVAPADAALPHITYQRISTQRDHHMTGSGELAQCRFQVTCHGTDYAAAADLADLCRIAMDTYRGQADDHEIRRIHLVDQRAGSAPLRDGRDQVMHFQILDFIIWHQETL